MYMMKTASKIFSLFIILSICNLPVYGQCPPASPGHHRVEKGETLYRISKKYQVSVEQICSWNGIQPNDILIVCQELVVSSPDAPKPPTDIFPPKPKSNLQQQQGGTHRIKPGETIAGLAELYGYTEPHFRDFNGLSPTEPAWPGIVLKTSDCNCPRPQMDETPVYVEGKQPENKGDLIRPADPLPNYPTWEETIATSEKPAYNDPTANPFGEDPFTGYAPTVYEKPDDRKDSPVSYRKEVEKITAPNSPIPADSTVQPSLSPEVRRSESGADAPSKTILSPEEELIKQTERQPAKTNNEPTSTGTTKPAGDSKNAAFMTAEENKMVKEINLLRSLPANYVKFVEDYRKRVAMGKAFGTVEACDELIEELKKSPPLSILSPLECVYDAAKKHGMEQLSMGKGTIDHIGRDGSYPSDRIKRECPNLVLGGENLVSGYADVRDAVILLLVDAGIDGRGHRRTLLDPTWKYVGCYKIGQVGKFSNYWVQNFGK